MLKKCGFTHIEIAADGQEGLNIFKKRGPNYFDLVTMDLEMPIMKGKEAMALIRQWEAENKIAPTKIIVISGNAIEKEVNECLDVNGNIRADAFLEKPCGYRALRDTIKRFELGAKEQLRASRKTSSSLRNEIFSLSEKPKILFADDDSFNRDILTAYAEKMNLEYFAAQDGEEACAIFEKNYEELDVILLDYKMPLMNGVEVCDKIRKKMAMCDKKCQIYLLSGVARVSDEISRKFDGVVSKPLTFENLRNSFQIDRNILEGI